MKRKNPKKKLVTLVVIIVVLFLIKYFEEEMIKSYSSEIETSSSDLIIEQSNVESKSYELNMTNIKLQENYSILNELKSGDKYNLHDLTYNEVLDFLNSYSFVGTKEMVEKAKTKGIRCAFVMVYVGMSITEVNGGDTISLGSGYHPLVGFNTLDQGMMYYEAETEYQVIPVIGQGYTDCVVGDPYLSGVFDNISNILEIW